MVDRWIPLCIALCTTALPSLSFAQTDPDATTIAPTRVPVPETADPAIESRATRILLGSLVSIGTVGLTLGAPTGWAVPLSLGSPSSSGVVLATMWSIGGVATVALVPLAYVTAADGINGRGKYWAALLGWAGGLALGSVFIALSATSPPTINSTVGIVGASIFMPVLGLAGQALAYEASMGPRTTDASPRARRQPGRASWLPIVSATPQSLAINVGGVF